MFIAYQTHPPGFWLLLSLAAREAFREAYPLWWCGAWFAGGHLTRYAPEPALADELRAFWL